VITQVSATDLFRAAYENRYTWDKSFPGYTAKVTLTQGDEVFHGQVEVKADLSATVSGIDNTDATDSIKGQLREVAIHRIRRTFEETHGKNTFEYGETLADGAIEILIGGKSSGDKYHLRNNEVVMVHRKIHGIVVTIHTSSSHDTGAGYLSHRYDSIYTDPQTGEAKGGKTLFTDNYTKAGNYFLISERILESSEEGQPAVTKFEFTDIQMVSA
jgi:Protein of unknown function (DUF3386)